MDVHQRIRSELLELERRGELRDLQAPSGIDFNSNDYLGLATDPRMKQAILEAVNAAPRIAATGSRLLSGHDEVWNALESEFAEWIGAEAALFFTSGYAAAVGLLSSVLQPEDVVFSDAANHACLIDGMRLAKCRRVIFPHLDLDVLEHHLHAHHGSGARFIVVESIFSMDGDRAPLAELAFLADRYGAELIVDEAHATGVWGSRGRGCIAEVGLRSRVFASIHTCGKALAAAGAFVCGSENLRRFLINRARTFMFNTALPPYFAAQVRAGMELAAKAERERAHLLDLSTLLRAGLHKLAFDTGCGDSHIVPVVLGTNEAALQVANELRARGFGVRAIRPPTVPAGTARLRFSLTAKVTGDDVAGLLAAMAQVHSGTHSRAVAYRP